LASYSCIEAGLSVCVLSSRTAWSAMKGTAMNRHIINTNTKVNVLDVCRRESVVVVMAMPGMAARLRARILRWRRSPSGLGANPMDS
jgi:hypothetical protein